MAVVIQPAALTVMEGAAVERARKAVVIERGEHLLINQITKMVLGEGVPVPVLEVLYKQGMCNAVMES